MKPSVVLDAAADLLAPKGAWTQGTYAMDADGGGVSSTDETAVRWCAYGAITRIDQGDGHGARVLFLAWLGEDVVQWNDAKGQTQRKVVNGLRRAAKFAREKGE